MPNAKAVGIGEVEFGIGVVRIPHGGVGKVHHKIHN